MEKILIKSGRVIDPSQKIDGAFDLLLEDGKVAQIKPKGKIQVADAQVIDATACVVTPGFIDLHCHLREPGQTYKESIRSGTKSAVAGGFTRVCCMPNTDPVNDSASVTEYILSRSQQTALCHVHPIGAITKGLKGEELAGIGGLKSAGCVAISDDGNTVQSANVLRIAMEYAKGFRLPIATHSADASLCEGGQINESFVSTKMGIGGIPNIAEDIIIARDIMLAEHTGARLHVCHVSTARGIELVAQAKERGALVTCEVTPHHLTLSDQDILDYDTNFKMFPPLRSKKDVQALRDALKKGGVIDAIATDHAPHNIIDKELEFDKSAFGIIGFETALPLLLNLVADGTFSLHNMVQLMTQKPASVFEIPGGSLKEGAVADVTIFNPQKEWVLEHDAIVSKSKNSPFVGAHFKGKVCWTIVAGQIKFSAS